MNKIKDELTNSRFVPFDREEYTVLETLRRMTGYFNNMIDNLESKTDKIGDHPGTWQGLSKPTLSQEGAFAQVEKNMSDIQEMKETLNNVIEFNIKNYGCVGDGVTDDTTSIKKAIEDFIKKGGSKLVIPSGEYKVSEPLSIDFKGGRNYTIDMAGYFKPIEGIGRVLSITNGVNVTANIKIKGGGLYKYHKGFSNTVTGLDVGLYVRAISGFVLNMTTDDFRGRGLEVETMHSTDLVKTDIFNLGKLIFRNIGQGVYCHVDSGIGCLGDIWSMEQDGSYFRGADMSINSYENVQLGEATIFEECVSLHLGRILLGERNNLIKFINCYNTTVQLLYLFGFNQVNEGCYIENCHRFDINIKCSGCNTACIINGLTEGRVNINSNQDKTVCYVATSKNAIDRVKFDIIAKDTLFTGFEVAKDGYAFDRTTLTGAFGNLVVSSKDVLLEVHDSYIENFNIPLENNIRVINNRGGSYTNEPKLKALCD